MTKWLFSFALKIHNFKENFNKYLKMCRFVFILTSVLALAGVHLSGRATRSLSQSDLIVTSHVTKNSSKFRPAHWARSNFRASQSSRVGLALPAHLAGRAGAESPQVAALSPEASPFYYSLCVFVGLWICVPSSNLSQFEEKISSRRRLHFDQPQPLGVLIWGLEASVKRIASGNCRGQQLNFCFWRVLLHKRLHSTVQRLPIENVDRGGFDSFTRFPRSMRKMKLKLFPTWNCLKK